MALKLFKNTVLFLVIMMVSCGNKSSHSQVEIPEKVSKNLDRIELNKSKISVGANQTDAYVPLLQTKRIAIVANQTSVIFKDSDDENGNDYTHLVDSLLQLSINIKKVFSPEHGFRGTADAGELVSDGKDKKTGLPIFSLHGKHKKPSDEQLQDVDIVVFDIQDVGVRFYTYISTLHYVMEACAENNIPLLIFDRPNPNGNYVDGPILEKEHSSFLGMHPIPLVHGMTIGEYANMINGEKWLTNGLQCNITVIEMKNYTHNSEYSLPIRPSPNLPNDQSIILYPSLGLFEGTNINAGRGTEFQFQRYGAPFLDNNHYTFNYIPQPNFGSKSPKHNGETCYGEDLSTIKVKREFTLKYIMDAYNHALDKSQFFNTANFTLHAGTAKLQKQIESGKTESEIRATWQVGLNGFGKIRSKYLIYD